MSHNHQQPQKQGLGLINTPAAKVLLLGSMPGEKSLAALEYYAHPYNAFWKIMATVTGVDAKAPYAQRIAGLRAANIALWDVIACCERSGSLDSNIKPSSVMINDFANFFTQQPQLQWVGLNGGKAFSLFTKHVVKTGILPRHVAYTALPSTSPAYTLKLSDKMLKWQAHLSCYLDLCTG